MKQKIVGLKDLREHMEEYISQVEKGKSFVVVRKSKPVFKLTPLDEEAPEGQWETVVDFTSIKKGGIKAQELLRHLKRLNEQN